MTDTNNNNSTDTTVDSSAAKKFSFENLEAALSFYADAQAGRLAIEKELEKQIQHTSDVCESILAQFGHGPFDLGDGHPRGHIVVKRGDLYFIRARNTGRPAGSKNKAVKSEGTGAVAMASAVEVASVAAEEMAPVELPEETVTMLDEPVSEALGELEQLALSVGE